MSESIKVEIPNAFEELKQIIARLPAADVKQSKQFCLTYGLSMNDAIKMGLGLLEVDKTFQKFDGEKITIEFKYDDFLNLCGLKDMNKKKLQEVLPI